MFNELQLCSKIIITLFALSFFRTSCTILKLFSSPFMVSTFQMLKSRGLIREKLMNRAVLLFIEHAAKNKGTPTYASLYRPIICLHKSEACARSYLTPRITYPSALYVS